MLRHFRLAKVIFQAAMPYFAVFWGLAASLKGDEQRPAPLAERPVLTIFVSSQDRIRQACETIFESVDRPDLATSINERLTGFRDLAGIEPTKPAGIMTVWDDEKPREIVFIPKTEIEELLKTATFGVVGYHQVTPDHYEIERPGSPYHVLVQKDYALFADSEATIRALRVSPLKLTQGLRDRYDAALKADLLQIPQPIKTHWIADLRQQIEPWLQPMDDEDEEQAAIRKSAGKLVLDFIEHLVLDTKSFTAGCRIDPENRHIIFELSIESVPKSRLSAVLRQLKAVRSEYSTLVQSDVAAGLAFDLPLAGIWEQLRKNPGDEEAKPSRLEIGLQLVGSKAGELSLITAFHGPDVEGMNASIPRWLERLESAGHLADLRESFDIHEGVVLHSLMPHELPTWITHWTGNNIEIIVGQATRTIWLGIGQPAPLVERLCNAIDLVAAAPENQRGAAAVKGRLSAKVLPQFLVTDILNSDPDAAEQEFSKGEDGLSLSLEPFPEGLKLKVELEEGFVRLIGRGWVKQIEESQAR
ncbi:hypothetical protein [Schlesneria sp. DSM 10557]|uniref:hypothetical protein n=1 Tax=Schlesneria sp. DSM 10557 TaxID=3044399 RepID=UPI0035A01853